MVFQFRVKVLEGVFNRYIIGECFYIDILSEIIMVMDYGFVC